MISAIYEVVLRPAYFGVFMDAWRSHIVDVIANPATDGHDADQTGADLVDPELSAHFARAYAILERMGRGPGHSGLADRIAQSDGFVLSANGDGRVIAASAAARQALGDDTRIDPVASMLTAGSAHVLHDAMRGLRDGRRIETPLVLSTGGHPRHLIVRSAPAPDAAILIEALDFRWNARSAQVLVDSFALSPAEVEIVRNLMAGYSLREIAARTVRSEHTVRNQTKSVLAKTGAPGQADLIRLVAFLLRDDGAAVGPGEFADLRSEVMHMPSGHAMQVFRAGAASGRPVIFLHGMQDGLAPVKHLDAGFRRHGFQVIAPVRPGYGRSDPVAGPDMAMQMFLDHVADLIDRSALQRPLILGHMAGAIYGHILTARLHGRVAGQVAVAGGVPVVRMRDLAATAARQRVIAYTARYTPALLPFILRAAVSQIDGDGFAAFLDGVHPPGSHDHRVIRRLGLAEPIRAGYRFSVLQGHLGFALDAHHGVRDWGWRLRAPVAPSILLHGVHDPVVTADMVRAFASGRAEVAPRILENAGQLLAYEHPDAVFSALEDLDRGRAGG